MLALPASCNALKCFRAAASTAGSRFPLPRRASKPVNDDSSGRTTQRKLPNPFDLEASELGDFARRLAFLGPSATGGDPVELERTWSALTFQVRGLADHLSTADAYCLIRGLSEGGVLSRFDDTCKALLQILLSRGTGVLLPRKVVNIWVAIDRAEAAGSEEASRFFHLELRRALPGVIRRTQEIEGNHTETDGRPQSCRMNSDRDWHRVLALLLASNCSSAELGRLWQSAEAAVLADNAVIRSLTSDGLVAALRAAAAVNTKTEGSVEPAKEVARLLCDRAVTQARWLNGWTASHVAAAASKLRAPPGLCYDPLRKTILDRCSALRSQPSKVSHLWTRRAAPVEAETVDSGALAEAERVADSLARFDVHDAEVRERLSMWLLRPVPADRFASMAFNLSTVGLTDKVAPKVARHVRARARSAEVIQSIGADAAEVLLAAYQQGGKDQTLVTQ